MDFVSEKPAGEVQFHAGLAFRRPERRGLDASAPKDHSPAVPIKRRHIHGTDRNHVHDLPAHGIRNPRAHSPSAYPKTHKEC